MADTISSDLDQDMKNSWGTDPVIFRAMDREFNFGLDVAANDKNHKCKMYFTKEHDALSQNWADTLRENSNSMAAWCNPPYGSGFIKQFMRKAAEESAKGVTTVMLVPSTLDAQWLPVHDISEIRIVTGGRLSFYHPESGKKISGNTKGSMFVIFRPSNMPVCIRLVDRGELLKAGE